MYVSMKEMLEQAMEQGRGVGAFNIHALEVVPVMAAAAAQLHAPVILQVSVSTAKYIGFGLLATVVRAIADREALPIALHLDHAREIEDIRAALEGGFSSVMIDGSALPLEENIELTCRAAALAREAGASIEAELGIVGRGRTAVQYPYTDPDDARVFVEQTGVDALAIGIGTCHGQYRSKTAINFDVLAEIHKRVDIPLVLHGGTGVKEEDLRRLIQMGMHKLNFGTELNVAWVRKAKEVFAAAEPDDSLRELMIPCGQAMKEAIQNKIRLVSI